MDLARAPRRARLTARKKGSGYENANFPAVVMEKEIIFWGVETLIDTEQKCLRYKIILVPRALLTRGATRGSGQIQNRIP